MADPYVAVILLEPPVPDCLFNVIDVVTAVQDATAVALAVKL